MATAARAFVWRAGAERESYAHPAPIDRSSGRKRPGGTTRDRARARAFEKCLHSRYNLDVDRDELIPGERSARRTYVRSGAATELD